MSFSSVGFANCAGCGKDCAKGSYSNVVGTNWSNMTSWNNDTGDTTDLGITDMSGVNPFNPPAPVDNSTDNSGSWLSDLSPNTALQGLTTVLGASINKGLFGGTGSGTGGSGKINTTTNTKTVQPSNNTPMVIGLVVLGAVGLGTLAYFVSKKTKK